MYQGRSAESKLDFSLKVLPFILIYLDLLIIRIIACGYGEKWLKPLFLMEKYLWMDCVLDRARIVDNFCPQVRA